MKLSWFDGGIYPPRPDILPDEVDLTSEGGVIFIGEKGILLHDTYGANPRLYPQSLTEAAAAYPRASRGITWSHELNWTKAIRGEAKASSPIEYAAQLTETMLLGLVALRAGQGEASVRRRARPGHQFCRRKPIFDPRISRRMGDKTRRARTCASPGVPSGP